MLKSIFKRILNNRFVSRVVFKLCLFFNGVKPQELLILATITKTGTHYVRFLLAYYLLLLIKKREGADLSEIRHDDFIVDQYFPNSWHTSYRFRKKIIKPTEKLKLLDLIDIPRSHMALKRSVWRGFKVLHTYRPVLDQTVVSWETKFKCNKDLVGVYPTVWDDFVDTYQNNLEQEESFKDISYCGINHLRIGFDQIYYNPEKTLALIVMWLGFEPDAEICNLAAKLSKQTPSVVVGGGEKWQRSFPKEIDRDYLTNFISENLESGAIGIHKKYFSSEQIDMANLKIEKAKQILKG